MAAAGTEIRLRIGASAGKFSKRCSRMDRVEKDWCRIGEIVDTLLNIVVPLSLVLLLVLPVLCVSDKFDFWARRHW